MSSPYPKKIQAFMDWLKQNPIADTGDVNSGDEYDYGSAAKKAKELGLKYLARTDNTEAIIFDPKVPNQAFTFGITESQMVKLTPQQQRQFDSNFKELFGLISDHDLSEQDRTRIDELRQKLQPQGITVTKVANDHDCYIGLSMGGHARYAHSTLTPPK